MPRIAATTAPVFHAHGVQFTSHVSTAAGSESLAAWRADFAPDTPGQAHTMSREEILYVLGGELDVEIGENEFRASTGDAVLVPAHTPFRVSNISDAPASAWVTTTVGMTATMLDSGDEFAPPWAQ